MKPAMRLSRQANPTRPGALRLLALLASLSATPGVAQTLVNLNEGTQLAITADHAGESIGFDLAGRIWLASIADGRGRPLTLLSNQDSRPALSPDGSQLAFERRFGQRHHIMLMQLASNEVRQLTFGAYDHHAPSWHPGGQRLLMASDRGGDYGIWEVDLATQGLRQLSFLPGDERDPAFSRSGQRLAFIHTDGRGDRLMIREPDGSLSIAASGNSQLHAPAWRPDESLLTYVARNTGRSELRMTILSKPPVSKALTRGENVFPAAAQWLDKNNFLYAADGRIRRRNFDAFKAADLPFSVGIEIPFNARSTRSSRLPDTSGSRAVVGITGVVPTDDGLYLSALGNIWQLDARGIAVRQFTSDASLDTDLSGNSSNSLLALSSDRGGSLQIWLLDPDSGELRQLSNEPGPAFAPAFNRQGTTIAYLTADHPAADSAQLKLLRLSDNSQQTLARGLPGAIAPSWLSDTKITVAVTGNGQPGISPALLAFDENSALPWTLPLPLPAGSQVSAARWSADGARLAVLSNQQLWLLERGANGFVADPRRLANQANLPRWSHQDGQLLFQDAQHRLQRIDPADGQSTELAVQLSWRPRAPDVTTVVRAGRVFDGLGPGYRERQDIFIRQGRIASMQPWGTLPPDAELIDASELTVIPGLIDSSARQSWPTGARAGRSWLAWGITSVREWSSGGASVLERQESWASGKRPGPRLISGLELCSANLPNSGRQLAQAWRLGFNGVEVCAAIPGEQLAEIVRLGRHLGLGVATAAPFPGLLLGADEISLTGRREVIDAYPKGFDRFAYGDLTALAGAGGLTVVSRLAPAGLPELARREDPLLSKPAFAALNSPAERYWYEESWRRQRSAAGSDLRAEQRTAGQSAFRAVARGARLVAGSNAPTTPRGLGLHAELRLLTESGLQPFQVLSMATLEAARALGLEQELGRISAGKRADLVLIQGDPLTDIAAASAVVATMVEGRLYRFTTLVPGVNVGNFYNPAVTSTPNPEGQDRSGGSGSPQTKGAEDPSQSASAAVFSRD
jgi:Tol biopolymer transport system component